MLMWRRHQLTRASDVDKINPFTVIGMLKRVAVPRGEWLLQTAAGSSLGKLVRQQHSFHGPYDGLASACCKR